MHEELSRPQGHFQFTLMTARRCSGGCLLDQFVSGAVNKAARNILHPSGVFLHPLLSYRVLSIRPSQITDLWRHISGHNLYQVLAVDDQMGMARAEGRNPLLSLRTVPAPDWPGRGHSWGQNSAQRKQGEPGLWLSWFILVYGSGLRTASKGQGFTRWSCLTSPQVGLLGLSVENSI